MFDALTDDELRKILALLVDQLNINLADRRMKVIVSPEVADWIDITCKDRSYGARPLRRAIQRYIEDPLAELIRESCRAGDRGVLRVASQLPSGRPTGSRRPPPHLERLNCGSIKGCLATPNGLILP